jgi:Phage tail tube protein
MPTTGIVNSSLLKIRTGATPVAMACLTDASFSASADMRDTSCKDTNAYSTMLPGKKSATLSGSGLWAFDAGATANAKVMHDALKAGTLITWSMSTGVTGDPDINGTGYVTSFEGASPGSFDNCTYSFELAVYGEWDWDVVS